MHDGVLVRAQTSAPSSPAREPQSPPNGGIGLLRIADRDDGQTLFQWGGGFVACLGLLRLPHCHVDAGDAHVAGNWELE
jgi:hypothetical protein